MDLNMGTKLYETRIKLIMRLLFLFVIFFCTPTSSQYLRPVQSYPTTHSMVTVSTRRDVILNLRKKNAVRIAEKLRNLQNSTKSKRVLAHYLCSSAVKRRSTKRRPQKSSIMKPTLSRKAKKIKTLPIPKTIILSSLPESVASENVATEVEKKVLDTSILDQEDNSIPTQKNTLESIQFSNSSDKIPCSPRNVSLPEKKALSPEKILAAGFSARHPKRGKVVRLRAGHVVTSKAQNTRTRGGKEEKESKFMQFDATMAVKDLIRAFHEQMQTRMAVYKQQVDHVKAGKAAGTIPENVKVMPLPIEIEECDKKHLDDSANIDSGEESEGVEELISLGASASAKDILCYYQWKIMEACQGGTSSAKEEPRSIKCKLTAPEMAAVMAASAAAAATVANLSPDKSAASFFKHLPQGNVTSGNSTYNSPEIDTGIPA